MKKYIITIAVLLFLSGCGQTQETSMNTFDSNFAHTVYFWLKNPESQEDRMAFEASLRKFLDTSAYAKTKFIGTPPRASRDEKKELLKNFLLMNTP